MRELQQIPIIPNGLRYWVLPDKQPETKIQLGDITLSGGDVQKEPPIQGRVLAVGDERVSALQQHTDVDTRQITYEQTSVPACKYKRGELVVFGRYAGQPHKIEGVEYTILHQDEILGRVIETPLTGLTQQ